MEVKIKQGEEMIDATIEMVDGVMVVSPKKVKVDVSQFKTGDVLVCGWEDEFNTCSWVCVLDGRVEEHKGHYFFEEYCGTYLVDGGDKESIWHNSNSDSATWIRFATEEEKQKLFDKLAEKGWSWDADKKELVKTRWRPEVGETFYRIGLVEQKFITTEHQWREIFYEAVYKHEWIFKTKEECDKHVERMNDVFKDECQASCQRLNDAISQVKP